MKPSNLALESPSLDPAAVDSIKSSITGFANASQVLRVIGAIIMTGSLTTFLFSNWEVVNDTGRYLQLLFLTGLLALGGFLLNIWLQENKGARVFFALSAIAVVANFTILGAFLYSVVQWDDLLGYYPKIAEWITTPTQLFITMSGALMVLLPITIFAFMVMARRSARLLAPVYLVLNALLLLPVREASIVGLIAFAGVALVIRVLRLVAADHTLNTVEGNFVRLLLFAPSLILLCRSMILYGLDDFVLLITLGCGYLILRTIKNVALNAHWVERAMVYLGFILALGIGVMATEVAAVNFKVLPIILVFSVAFCGVIYDIHRQAHWIKDQALVIGAASLVMGLALVANAAFGDAVDLLFSLIVAIVMIIQGYVYQHRFALMTAILSLCITLFLHVDVIMQLINFKNWITLAVIGGIAIIGASVLERHGVTIRHKLIVKRLAKQGAD